ncbi:MAG TPA: 1,6-anhydro-N-acetylmuramyl-L-alanine amidase AmpD, partial [Comamonadaceae bacterium]|nr:1,6-anhydro-N-acetylmuramyl-L-alanine amidase AmpD [Comamonadaceae bacterium]
TGVVWQFVDAERRAWHAGRSHYRGRDNCNDDSVGIELEGLEGLRFEPAQYAALLRLCRALMQRFPIRFIAGHEHIAPQRKGDPGSGFEWHRMWRTLAGSGVLLPPGTAARP